MKVFSIFDAKAQVYRTPFFMIREGEAVRAFVDLVKDRNTIVGKHAGDFRICRIGEFNEDTGELQAETPVILMSGDAVLADVSTKLEVVS